MSWEQLRKSSAIPVSAWGQTETSKTASYYDDLLIAPKMV
jgi:hypothetical protein